MRKLFVSVVRARIAAFVVAGGVAASGCAFQDNAAFEPLGASSGTVRATYPVAKYEVRVGPAVVGDATIWSEGRSKPEHMVDLRMKLRNRTNAPISIDLAKTDLNLWTRAGAIVLATPVRVGGSNTVVPDATGNVSLGYALPPGVAPNDVTGFRFDWLVRTPAGDYRQSTDFGRTVVADRGATCPDYPDYEGVGGPCSGWDQGRWFGYDNPADPAMPTSGH